MLYDDISSYDDRLDTILALESPGPLPLPTPPHIIHQMSSSCLTPHSPSSGQSHHHHLQSSQLNYKGCLQSVGFKVNYLLFVLLFNTFFSSPHTAKTGVKGNYEGLPLEIFMSATFLEQDYCYSLTLLVNSLKHFIVDYMRD